MTKLQLNEIKNYLDKIPQPWVNFQSLFYLIPEKIAIEAFFVFANYLYIDPKGNIWPMVFGFYHWCKKQNLDFEKTALEYIEINKPYNKLREKGLINATQKAKGVFGEDLQLDEMYFCEFYNIPRFGKTYTGQLLLHSKQTQNQKYIDEICHTFAPEILELAQGFESLCFAPPSTPRNPQFMDVLNETVGTELPRIKSWKHFEDIAIQQKTLKSKADRIENARETIFLESSQVFKSCLIIDDAIGSGSTLNEIARKLKTQKIVTGKVVGIGIVGNLDGFEVINEV
jgi:hypothetical protein